MAEETVFLSRTVLLETEWVLRSRYNKSRSELLAFLRALLETENTVVEAAEALGHAVEWCAQGADFADALHLAACGSSVMHTFDRDFCTAAREAGSPRRSGCGRFETSAADGMAVRPFSPQTPPQPARIAPRIQRHWDTHYPRPSSFHKTAYLLIRRHLLAHVADCTDPTKSC
jgi:predicted nucleic-acid-binding protein